MMEMGYELNNAILDAKVSAKQLAKNYCLSFVGLPENCLVGINFVSFTATRQFRGVRDLPLGLNCVFVGVNSSLSLRCGIWFEIKNTTLNNAPSGLTFKWNDKCECIEIDHEWAEEIGGFNGYFSYWNKVNEDNDVKINVGFAWKRLTQWISKELLDRITQGKWTLNSGSTGRQDIEINELTDINRDNFISDNLNFMAIDVKKTWSDGLTGSQRSEAARDRSWALNNLIEHHTTTKSIQEILGEFQFSFITILSLNNYSSLQQWKRILEICFTCKRIVEQRPAFYEELLDQLYLQLNVAQSIVEEGLFDLTNLGSSFLISMIYKFRQLVTLELESSSSRDRVTQALETFHNRMVERFNLNFNLDNQDDDDDDSVQHSGILGLDDHEPFNFQIHDPYAETGEYAPVIIETSQLHHSSHSPNNS